MATGTRPSSGVAEHRWWDLIERARKHAEDPDAMADALVDLLQQELDADDIVQFDKFINERLRDAFRWDLWAVAYIMNGGCSDDGFDDFCGWLIGQGRTHYEAALANPEAAANGTSPEDEPFENESLLYAASRAWEAKTGKSTAEFDDVAIRVERRLQGEPFDEDSVYDDHPELAKRFGG